MKKKKKIIEYEANKTIESIFMQNMMQNEKISKKYLFIFGSLFTDCCLVGIISPPKRAISKIFRIYSYQANKSRIFETLQCQS